MAQTTARVLIFSATTGYRHASIPVAVGALTDAGPAHYIAFDHTEDSTRFNDHDLANYDAVLFLMVTDVAPNDVLNVTQQQALQDYFNKGGNFVGIHSASDCLHDAAFYGREIGAYFNGHPPIGTATFLNTIDPTHPTVNMIPERWTYTEEVYSFKSDPRSVGSKVVLTVDETAIGGEPNATTQGSPHPIAWYQERGAGTSDTASLAGRSFYTSLGHLNSTWADPIFMGHVMAGVTWALGANTTKAFSSSGLVGNPPLSRYPSTGSPSYGGRTTSNSTDSVSDSEPGANSASNSNLGGVTKGAVLVAAALPLVLP